MVEVDKRLERLQKEVDALEKAHYLTLGENAKSKTTKEERKLLQSLSPLEKGDVGDKQPKDEGKYQERTKCFRCRSTQIVSEKRADIRLRVLCRLISVSDEHLFSLIRPRIF